MIVAPKIGNSNKKFFIIDSFKKDAEKAEKFFKTGYGREVLKDKISNYLHN